MALLGHASRIVISSLDPALSRGVWEQLGFEDAGSTSEIARLTDGQVLLSLISHEDPSPGLAYFAPSLQSVADKLTAAGIAFVGSHATSLHLQGPGELTVWIHPATMNNVIHRSGEDSPFFGYLDAVVVPVANVSSAADWAQKCGFFIVDQWDDPSPQVDVTDGLTTISFRQQAIGVPFLHYTADMDNDWVESITEACGELLTIHRSVEGKISMAVITMPDACLILITPDEY